MTKTEIIKNIESTYPIKVVNDLKNTNEELYNQIYKISKDKKKTIKDVVEEFGFKYSRKPLGELLSDDVIILLKIYPDKVITSLADKEDKIYYKILSHAKLMNMELKQYLQFLGFVYDVQKEEITRNYLEKELNKLYKDKNIVKLSINQPQLYNKLYKFAQKEKTSITKLVEEMGFKIDLEENYKNNRRKHKKIAKDEPKKVEKNVKNASKGKTKKLSKDESVSIPAKRRGRPRKNVVDIATADVVNK